ncbi:MAG: hypothetical protein HZB81_08130 [Deltaproteobacteria bacterium]|nr:hypothetical protein [Deltaproteobacteria bacterium]
MKNILCLSTAVLYIAISLLIAGCDANTIDTVVTVMSAGRIRWCNMKDYGTVEFSNNSSTKQDYWVYWDNNYVGIVKVGKTEPEGDDFTTKSGNHTLEFKFTSSGATACGPETVTISKCEHITYTCSN